MFTRLYRFVIMLVGAALLLFGSTACQTRPAGKFLSVNKMLYEYEDEQNDSVYSSLYEESDELEPNELTQ